MALNSRIILQTIHKDLSVYDDNLVIAARRKDLKKEGINPRSIIGSKKPTTVLNRHLRNKKNEVEVLDAMIAGRSQGTGSKNKFTRLLYDDLALLEEARDVARKHYGK